MATQDKTLSSRFELDHANRCIGELGPVDAHKQSKTLHCSECETCVLELKTDHVSMSVPLDHFYYDRLSDKATRSIDDRTLAELLHICATEDRVPPQILRDEFGITTPDHFAAIQYATNRCDIGPYELDRIMGDGRAITQLVDNLPLFGEKALTFEAKHDPSRVSRAVERVLDRFSHSEDRSNAWQQDIDKKQTNSCACGSEFELVDEHGSSKTYKCENCHRCALEMNTETVSTRIQLGNFYQFRLGEHAGRGASDRTMAENLYMTLVLDTMPSMGQSTDFGIKSTDHLGNLQAAVKYGGISAYDLDRVLGDGPAITELVNSVPDNPFRSVTFQTPYDDYLPDFKQQVQTPPPKPKNEIKR